MSAGEEQEFCIAPVLVIRRCGACGQGQLKPNGVVYPTAPVQYLHACDKDGCEGKANFTKRYPFVRFHHIDDWNTGVAAEL